MATVSLVHQVFSQSSLRETSKSSNIKRANFTQIPTWISLKSNAPQLPIEQGKLENVHLVSLSKQGKLKEAHDFILEMDRFNVPLSPQSYKDLLDTCSNIRSLHYGKLIHSRLNGLGENPPVFLMNYVLEMYCCCGSLLDARKLFDEMSERSLGSWVVIISAYADEGMLEDGSALFLEMQGSSVEPNASIYISLLKSFKGFSCLQLGKQMHCLVIKAGLANNVALGTTLCSMYMKCGCLESAEHGFELMHEKTSVTWTTMMVGCTQADRQENALRYFAQMVKEDVDLDEFVFSITLKACAALGNLEMGEQVHGLIAKLGLECEVSVGTPLVDFYVKNGDVESARQVFERINEPNDVSWSAILCGYSQIGEFDKCVKILQSLRNEGDLLNESMYTSIFQLCSGFAEFDFGAQAHGDALKRGLVSPLYGESALISMYAKCGRLDFAYQVFESMDEPDNVAWTSMIAACAYHGNASEALKLFKRMKNSKVRANSVTFLAVFTACSHAGLVEEGKEYLRTMSAEHGVDPTIYHYDCMIDIYSRAGLLNEAFDLIKTMPFEPGAMSWKTLLGGCSIRQNFELGEIAALKLLALEPTDSAAYILMFNLYASGGRWDEAAKFRTKMAEKDLKKEIGCSWITAKGKVHRFVVGDQHHPQTEEIYSKLQELSFIDGKSVLTEDEMSYIPPRRAEQLLVHSERLAIAFGLISTTANAPIVVFKNLRACKNCHDFAKHVSYVTNRRISVRDSNRFHHFESGQCSCGDYW